MTFVADAMATTRGKMCITLPAAIFFKASKHVQSARHCPRLLHLVCAWVLGLFMERCHLIPAMAYCGLAVYIKAHVYAAPRASKDQRVLSKCSGLRLLCPVAVPCEKTTFKPIGTVDHPGHVYHLFKFQPFSGIKNQLNIDEPFFVAGRNCQPVIVCNLLERSIPDSCIHPVGCRKHPTASQ